MSLSNPLNNPILLPTLEIIAVLFVLGSGIILFFGRKDLRHSLTGELGQRYVSWMVVAPVYLLAAFTGGVVALVILLAFIVQLVREYSRVTGVERAYAIYLYGMIPFTLFMAGFVSPLFFALPAGALFFLTAIPILTRRVDNLYQQLSYAGRGYLYLVWTSAHLVLLRQLNDGVGLLLVAGLGAALSDICAFTVGKLFGKHLISPPVNPRKAWEGVLGDLLGALLTVVLFRFVLPPSFNWIELAILGLIIGLGSAWGDMISSLAKRASDVKDWGGLLPGHGGMLDRANSFVVVLPSVYYYLVLLKFFGWI